MLDFPITICNISGHISYVDLSINRVQHVCDCNKKVIALLANEIITRLNKIDYSSTLSLSAALKALKVMEHHHRNRPNIVIFRVENYGVKYVFSDVRAQKSQWRKSRAYFFGFKSCQFNYSFGNTDKSFCQLIYYQNKLNYINSDQVFSFTYFLVSQSKFMSILVIVLVKTQSITSRQF